MRLSEIQKQVTQSQSELQVTRQTLDSVKNAQPATVQIATLTARTDAVQDQLKLLNDAIGQSPDKALAVPLLKKMWTI
jgi:hypothetical protein